MIPLRGEAISIITYKTCAEANEDAVFEAFQTGFSDYMIKFDMTKELFFKHFFGREGNSPDYSVVAFEGDKPVGLILGGIKMYEGIKTLRCGAFCVHPDYRGTEVSRNLFALHKEIALANRCKQMCLEVIVGNDRAINFYKKQGYEKVYDLIYYTHHNPSEIQAALPEDATIRRLDLDDLRTLRNKLRDVHINWQNDLDSISNMVDQAHYGIFQDAELIGGLSIHPAGRIHFLWVDTRMRNRGIGSGLITHAVKELNPKRLDIHFPNHAALMGFVRRLNFEREPISQYEMYLPL